MSADLHGEAMAIAHAAEHAEASAPDAEQHPNHPQQAVIDALDDETMFRYALKRLRNPELAEELVQEARLAAIRAQRSFEGRSTARTWQMGILKHKIADHFRRIKRERPLSDVEAASDVDTDSGTHSMLEAGRPWSSHRHAEAEPPAAGMEKEQFWTDFEGCMLELPPRLAEAFRLREIEQLTNEEICERLDITPANYWVMLHRARRRLQRCLTQSGYTPAIDATTG